MITSELGFNFRRNLLVFFNLNPDLNRNQFIILNNSFKKSDLIWTKRKIGKKGEVKISPSA